MFIIKKRCSLFAKPFRSHTVYTCQRNPAFKDNHWPLKDCAIECKYISEASVIVVVVVVVVAAAAADDAVVCCFCCRRRRCVCLRVSSYVRMYAYTYVRTYIHTYIHT